MTHPRRCQGFALPTLMVMLTLASVATMLAWRNLWVNDMLLNADADQFRTQHKAEAVLPVALADILGTTPTPRHTAGNATQTHAFFPNTLADYEVLRQRLNLGPCNAGICAPNTLDVSATKASYWKAQTATAMVVGAIDTPYGDNTAWYWVEIFPQANSSSFVYRITTLANGVMPGSSTVIQTIWARNSLTANTGQWHSWHVLHD